MLNQSALACTTPAFSANENDPIILPDINLTCSQLTADVTEAMDFCRHLHDTADLTPEKGLLARVIPDWAPQLVRRQGIAGAVIEKVGSRLYIKRRPDDASPFLAYVQKQADRRQPLLFRVVFGPLKNVNICGCRQDPDWAEYLTIVQLARLMQALAGVYPYGLKVQLVPDDRRACQANLCPEIYVTQYIAGLQKLICGLELENLITVENGQKRLYAHYNVLSYSDQAAAELNAWRSASPEDFFVRWSAALENARRNLAGHTEKTPAEIESSAWRYLVAHRAEILSGLWSPQEAFPLVYANHSGNYQLYTMGWKKTKLPWQISLPLSLLPSSAHKA